MIITITESCRRLGERVGLFAPFVGKGDLVFDIGANVGEYTRAFLALGARVVAVEPNPDCLPQIMQLSSSSAAVRVEPVAAGDHEGQSVLHVAAESSLSTTSPAWVAIVNAAPHGAKRWVRTIVVPVTTLDRLAEKHGSPVFVKIDVEGSEDRVVAGMSFRPRALSFEYQSADLGIAERCLAQLDGYKFNYTAAEESHLRLRRWLDAASLIKELRRMAAKYGFGDVIATRKKGLKGSS